MTERRLLDRIGASFEPVLMNLDEQRDWAYRHNVTLHPCIVFTDDTGEVWGSALEMETSADAILERMQDTLDIMAELGAE